MSLQGNVAMMTVGNTALFPASNEASSPAGTALVVGGGSIAA
jgi:hypothetical protein